MQKLITFLALLALALLPGIADAQKLAKYTTGTIGHDDYEEISFWSDKKIGYKKGQLDEQNVQYYGATVYSNNRAFLLMLPGNELVRVVSSDEGVLYVSGITSKYFKVFTWKHDGPVNNKGVCMVCMPDVQQALNMVKRNYM